MLSFKFLQQVNNHTHMNIYQSTDHNKERSITKQHEEQQTKQTRKACGQNWIEVLTPLSLQRTSELGWICIFYCENWNLVTVPTSGMSMLTQEDHDSNSAMVHEVTNRSQSSLLSFALSTVSCRIPSLQDLALPSMTRSQ